MMFNFFMCLLIGISAVSSAPVAAPAPVDEVQGNLQKDFKEALSPVQTEVRAMIGNVENALRDVANTAVEATKKELAPLSEIDRANIGPNIISRGIHSLVNAQRSILQRAIEDFNPLKVNAKSILDRTNDAINALQTKFLTSDGQDLAKQLYKFVGTGQNQ